MEQDLMTQMREYKRKAIDKSGGFSSGISDTMESTVPQDDIMAQMREYKNNIDSGNVSSDGFSLDDSSQRTMDYRNKKSNFVTKALTGANTRGEYLDFVSQDPASVMGSKITNFQGNIKKGEGSGIDGKRTVGDFLTRNLPNAVVDVAGGAAKGILTTPMNLARLTNFLIPGKDTNPFKGAAIAGSPESQAFNEAFTGKNTLEKVGRTGFDIASLLSGAGEAKGASLAGQLVSKSAKGAELLSDAGKAGKLTRFATKTAGQFLPNMATGAMASHGDVNGVDVAGGVLGPVVGKAIGAVARRVRGVDEGVRSAKRILSEAEKGNMAGVGEMNTAIKNSKDTLKAVTENLSRTKSEKITDINENFGNVEEFGNVLDSIIDNYGGVGGTRSGKTGLELATGSLQDDILKNAIGPKSQIAEDVLSSSNAPAMSVDYLDKLGKNVAKKYKDSTRAAEVTNAINTLKSNITSQGKRLTPVQVLYELRGLRDKAYKSSDGMSKRILKDVASELENYVKNNVKDVPAETINKLFDSMRKDYLMIDALQILDGATAPGVLSDKVAGLMGGTIGAIVGGPGTTGFLASAGGNILTKGINKLAGESKLTGMVNNKSVKELTKQADLVSKEMSSLSKEADDIIKANRNAKEVSKAVKLKKYIDKLKSDAISKTEKRNTERKIKDFISKNKLPLALPEANMSQVSIPLPGKVRPKSNLVDYVGKYNPK